MLTEGLNVVEGEGSYGILAGPQRWSIVGIAPSRCTFEGGGLKSIPAKLPQWFAGAHENSCNLLKRNGADERI
jgi:hypothetical protein